MGETHATDGLGSFVYQSDSATHLAEFDWETTAPSLAVVAALAETIGTDPLEIEPLYASVDADALDSLIGDAGALGDDAVSVSMTVAGHAIEVCGSGLVSITPSGGGQPDTGRGDASGE